jgi:hypothetical protein
LLQITSSLALCDLLTRICQQTNRREFPIL